MADKINVFFRAKARSDRVDEFVNEAIRMMKAAREEDGCLAFIYHQSKKDNSQFLLYESWRDREALDAHMDALKEYFGPCEEGQIFPAKLLDFWEEWSADICDIVTEL